MLSTMMYDVDTFAAMCDRERITKFCVRTYYVGYRLPLLYNAWLIWIWYQACFKCVAYFFIRFLVCNGFECKPLGESINEFYFNSHIVAIRNQIIPLFHIFFFLHYVYGIYKNALALVTRSSSLMHSELRAKFWNWPNKNAALLSVRVR